MPHPLLVLLLILPLRRGIVGRVHRRAAATKIARANSHPPQSNVFNATILSTEASCGAIVVLTFSADDDDSSSRRRCFASLSTLSAIVIALSLTSSTIVIAS